MAKKERRPKASADRIRRAIASSTAIETGQSITQLESHLKSGSDKFKHLKLAL